MSGVVHEQSVLSAEGRPEHVKGVDDRIGSFIFEQQGTGLAVLVGDLRQKPVLLRENLKLGFRVGVGVCRLA